MSGELTHHDRIPLAAPALGEPERERVGRVLESGMLAAGEEVERFEAEFAAFCGADHGVATSNGTTALHAALHALGVGPGDRVVTTPLSFVATANAIRFCGARPVFADVDPTTYALDPDAVARVLRGTDDVAAMVVVHLYGLPAAMDRLAELAEEHDVALVEDAAQAHGAEFQGRRVGSIGDVGCFSFYPTKNMTTGEGGMIVTDREGVAERAARFVNHGRRGSDEHVEIGHNFRLTDLAAAIGRVQLERLPEFNARRRENAARLTDGLSRTDVGTPSEPGSRRHVYHQYTIRTADRAALRAHLDEHGIGSGVYYPTPIHRQPAYADVDGSFPAAERAAGEVVSLPVHPGVSEPDCRRIVDAVAGVRS